jgi:hypothetical protein
MVHENDATIATAGFDWTDWQAVRRNERLKRGTDELADVFARVAR